MMEGTKRCCQRFDNSKLFLCSAVVVPKQSFIFSRRIVSGWGLVYRILLHFCQKHKASPKKAFGNTMEAGHLHETLHLVSGSWYLVVVASELPDSMTWFLDNLIFSAFQPSKNGTWSIYSFHGLDFLLGYPVVPSIPWLSGKFLLEWPIMRKVQSFLWNHCSFRISGQKQLIHTHVGKFILQM